MPNSRSGLSQCVALVVTVIFAFFVGTAAGSPDPLVSGQGAKGVKKQFRPARLSRSRSIDVKHIALDLRFDWERKRAYGLAAVTLAPLHPTRRIALDAGMLTIKSISLADGTPLSFVYDGGDKNDGLVINLDRPYRVSEDLTVRINYHTNWINQPDPNSLGGTNGKGLRFSAPTSNDPTKPREIWSMGEPESNRYWFPGYDAPNDLRTTEFIATVDKPLMVISNGSLVQTKEPGDGTRTYHWKMDAPYANHLTAFVVGEYIDLRQGYTGVELHNYSYPLETAATAASVERLPDMFKFFSERIGVRYPYPSYSQVFVQDSGWGVGNVTLATQSENMVDDDRTHQDFLYLWDALEGETLAQQWFGGYVAISDWSQLWLNKGFARYFSGLYNEYKNGRDEFLLYHLGYDQSVYFGDWNAGIRHPIVNQHDEDATQFAADNYPLSRGALVLHMLRKQLGEEKWWRTIRHYVRTNAGKLVATNDFRRAIEEATGEPMNWFFDQWLYKAGHPCFEVSKNYDQAKKRLTLTIRQTQKIDPAAKYPQVEFFQGKVEIEIDGRIEQVWLNARAENIYTFAAAVKPKIVNFDYEGTWIKEIKYEQTLDELLYQLQHDRDILGRRSALNELAKIARDRQTTAEVRDRVYDGFRQLILSDRYWRLRMNALTTLQSLLAPVTETNPVPLDEVTTQMLLIVIKKEKAWLRSWAITFLGMTREAKYSDLYLQALDDQSDRVIYAAAIALGKTKSPRVFEALVKLKDKPSWKNQSLIAALNGLKELRDPRGFEVAFEALSDLKLLRWRLPTQLWDLRITAAETIVALGKSSVAYPMIYERFKRSMEEDDLNGIFNNVLLIATLADSRGQEVIELLKAKYKDDPNAMKAISQYESQFKESLKR